MLPNVSLNNFITPYLGKLTITFSNTLTGSSSESSKKRSKVESKKNTAETHRRRSVAHVQSADPSDNVQTRSLDSSASPSERSERGSLDEPVKVTRIQHTKNYICNQMVLGIILQQLIWVN